MVATLEQIETALPRLSKKELKALRARIHALAGPESAPDAGTSDLLYAEIVGAVKTTGGRALPFAVFAKTPAFKSYKTGSECFLEFVETSFKPKTRTERVAAIRTAVGMVAKHARRFGQDVTVQVLAVMLENIASICERQFPGYRAAGLLHVLVRGFTV